MTRSTVVMALLMVGIPGTALGFYGIQGLTAKEPQRANAPRMVEEMKPLDLRSADNSEAIPVIELPVYIEVPRPTAAPMAEPEPDPDPDPEPEPEAEAEAEAETPPPPKPVVREVLAGQSVHQSRASYVKTWGVQGPAAVVPTDAEQRRASELRKHYRREQSPSFDGITLPIGQKSKD